MIASPGFSCCVDLDRAAAAEHSVNIFNIPQGTVSVIVSAYLEPAGSGEPLGNLCDTNGVGVECTTVSTLTYTSNPSPTPVTIVPGATTVAQVLVYSVPFLLDNFVSDGEEATLSPAPGGTAFPLGMVLAALVDATTPVCDPTFSVTQSSAMLPVTLTDLVPCDDNNPELSPCSGSSSVACLLGATPGATPSPRPCQVQGWILSGRLPRELNPGAATIEFKADNIAGARLATPYSFTVELPTATPTVTPNATPSPTPSDTPVDTPTPSDTPVDTPTETPSPSIQVH
jgi:hypothetical protein